MPLKIIQHAIGLHLHQPAGALLKLLQQDEGELRRILLCYERLARHAHKYAHVARLHVALSGVLLEQLHDPAFIKASRHLADIPAILDSLRSAPNIEFVGTGYRHASLPLIPSEDWEEQLRNERVTMESVLGRVLKGYFPPASRFTLELIPALVRAGYEYVLLPNTALLTPDGHGTDPYRAYRLRHLDASIDVVPWDRGFSLAQESGMDAAWLADEARNGVAQSPESGAPYLLTTWSDGDAGEWFRRMDEEQGFYGHFFSPCMEFCETGEFPVQPIQLAEYLRDHRPETEVDLVQEMQAETLVASLGAEAQAARKRLFAVVARYWSVVRLSAAKSGPSRATLQEARELILQAEESDFLLDASRCGEMLDMLERADKLLAAEPAQPKKAAQPEPAHQHGKSAAPEIKKLLEPPAVRPSEQTTPAKSPVIPKVGNPPPGKPDVELTLPKEGNPLSGKLVAGKSDKIAPPAPSVPPPARKGATTKAGKTVQSRSMKKKTHKK